MLQGDRRCCERPLATAVLTKVYAQICPEIAFRSHVELSEKRRNTCPRYGAVAKAHAGHAPVPK
eukprot:8191241-Karenia_brevis.AAC.1